LRAILLKGAAIATWLYDDGSLCPCGDADLLVAPADFATAEGVLSALGFALRSPGLSPLEETPCERVWMRGGALLDLHRSLWGVGAEPSVAWALLSEGTGVLSVGGGTIEVLGPPARPLHVALHAAQHGRREAKPRQDLARAASRVPLDTWRQAAELAGRLHAAPACRRPLPRSVGRPPSSSGTDWESARGSRRRGVPRRPGRAAADRDLVGATS
jgi:hypothetical protein